MESYEGHVMDHVTGHMQMELSHDIRIDLCDKYRRTLKAAIGL